MTAWETADLAADLAMDNHRTPATAERFRRLVASAQLPGERLRELCSSAVGLLGEGYRYAEEYLEAWEEGRPLGAADDDWTGAGPDVYLAALRRWPRRAAALAQALSSAVAEVGALVRAAPGLHQLPERDAEAITASDRRAQEREADRAEAAQAIPALKLQPAPERPHPWGSVGPGYSDALELMIPVVGLAARWRALGVPGELVGLDAGQLPNTAGGLLLRAVLSLLRVDVTSVTLAELDESTSADGAAWHRMTEASEARRNAARRLVTILGPIEVRWLEQHHLESYRDQRIRAGGAPSTARLDLQALCGACRWGREVGIEIRVVRMPSIRAERRYNDRTPTAEEVVAVLAQTRPERHRVALLLMWCTGARVGEICCLRWCDIDIDQRRVRLHGRSERTRGKSAPRSVPISPEAAAGLQALHTAAGDAPSEAPAIASVLGATSATRSAIAKACRRADVEPWTPHGLRRLAVDELLRAGVDPGTAAAITGHSPTTMLRYYRRATDDDIDRAVSRARLGRQTPSGGRVIAGPWEDAE